MVVVVGKPETAESVRELNFRGEFEVCEIVERSIPAIQRQLEQSGEQVSHLVYDVRIIGNIDQSLGLLERICVTIPGIKIIVVTEGLSTDSAFMKDILTLVPAEQIVSDHGAELKRVLNTILNQEGGKTDVHPEIQELQAKIDQTYAAMAADPQRYLEYLNFRGQCVGMGVENSVAVFAQNPKATYCPSPESIGSPKVKPGEEDNFISVLRTDGIERVYALEQYDLSQGEYLDKAPLQWSAAQHGDLMHRVEDAAHLAEISIMKDIRHGPGFFDAGKNTIHVREGENDTEQLKSLLEGYSEAVITRTSTSDRPVAELESASLAALLQVRCGVMVDDQLAERISAALEDAKQVSSFSMKDSVARLHNAMEYCVRYAELEQTSEQYQAHQIEPEALTPQSEAFMEMM